MKILVANEYLAPIGGSEQYMLSLCEELEKRGHKISVVYGEETGREEHKKDRNQYFLPHTLSLRSGKNKEGLKKLEAIMKKENPDVTYIQQVHNPFATEVLIQTKPCVRYFHGNRIICPAGHHMLVRSDRICGISVSRHCMLRAYTERCMPRNVFLSNKLIRSGVDNVKASMNLKKFIVPSNYSKLVLMKTGFPEEHIEVIPYFTSLPPLAKESRSEKTPANILFVGRLVQGKGLRYLIEALKYVDTPWRCTVIGEGPEQEPAKILAKKLGISKNMHFTGWLPHIKIAEYYQQAFVVVVPSIWIESFGIIGIEAMSHTKPVIGFDAGGISEWLKDGRNGFLIPRKDVQELAKKMNKLLRERGLAEKLGKQGRTDVENRFTKEIHINRLMIIFESVLKNSFSLNH